MTLPGELVRPDRPVRRRARAWRSAPEAEAPTGATLALQQLVRTAHEFERAVWDGQVLPPDVPADAPEP